MPAVAAASMDESGGATSSENGHYTPQNLPGVYQLPRSLGEMQTPSMVCIAWGSGNKLRLSFLQHSVPAARSNTGTEGAERGNGNGASQSGGGAAVIEIELGGRAALGLDAVEDAEKRRIAYGSLPAFALLQNKRKMLQQAKEFSGMLPDDWWEHVLEYSYNISNLLAPTSTTSMGLQLDKKSRKEKQEQTLLRAVWELTEIFFVDKHVTSWIPEKLVDWLTVYDRALARTEPTVQTKLVALQHKLPNIQFPEDDADYWEGACSALAVGWLDIVIKFLRMHGSYRLDQIDNRQTENGLVEAVTVLISKMPRLRPHLPSGAPGIAYGFKPDFAKAWEKWRSQVAKLDNSMFWSECNHHGTLLGLKKLLQILLGNVDALITATCHWIELLVAHFLYIVPFSMVAGEILSIARKCKQLKHVSGNENLRELLLAIISNDTEIVLAECSQLFGPWMMAHVVELLTAKSTHAQALLLEERSALGSISLEELHRVIYAQVLSSHHLTWQLSPTYLASCPKQGCGLLENVLLKQPVSGNSRLFLKVLDISRLYDLGVVGTALSRHLEGLLDLLDSEVRSAQGLSFLHRYRDFKNSLHEIREYRSSDLCNPKVTVAGRHAADCLLQLLKPGASPLRFWLSILHDSVDLLEWPQQVLLNEVETTTLMTYLQELKLAEARGDVEAVNALSSEQAKQQLDRVRLALALNLGRAILQS
ncbi:hypothetical protein O6H91_01G032400 [Diphasiastrum complanatum]|uniref:Uncharacterized protein n=1 Tax=Diphasiastrum complanatum TaxID=34168 RepID=A0ACC2EPR7_DIPCM|nr:hypothetical protein O6H91_01G032400 [Diphasiastrum complanatum]